MYRIASSMLSKTLTIILAGGQGERLYPLTKDRSKPSVPFAGGFRIVDFTLSNCINSGLRHIFLLTQYKSQSLNRHIRDGWNILNRELREFVESVPPQKRTHTSWYEGTADAICQNIYLLEQFKPDRVLILSGDHIYRMDYLQMLAFHVEKGADATIASCEYPREQSSSFGVLQVDENDRVLRFVEKPSDPPPLPGKSDRSLVNMGVYVFNTPILVRAVIDDSKRDGSIHDLGKDVFPRLTEGRETKLYSYSFNRQAPHPYWRDVGHISSYFEANMEMLRQPPAVDLFSKEWPFRTDIYQYPPSFFHLETPGKNRIQRSIVGAGCRIEGELDRCVFSPSVAVGAGSILESCIVFHNVVIGRGCRIKNAIIDKNAVIPDGCVIGYDPDTDSRQFTVTPEKIVVIPKDMIVEYI
ncbi:MAG: glucose-1-phosphate adenylyltransferase [Candidatus Omnitrophota bacterium]